MKKLLVSLAATAALVFVANSAWALSVSLDVPVSFSFDEGGTADSVSGFKVGVGLPLFPLFGVGLGYENYEAKLKDNGVTGKGLYEFYDLFLEIPFPIVNLTVGGGVGQAQLEVDSAGGGGGGATPTEGKRAGFWGRGRREPVFRLPGLPDPSAAGRSRRLPCHQRREAPRRCRHQRRNVVARRAHRVLSP